MSVTKFKINLDKDFKNYLILGGNHRLRLFYGELKDSIVILKSGENQKFIKNDIAIRTENNLSYAPKIFDSENDWLREEYFNGIPFNRIESEERKGNLRDVIINNHFRINFNKCISIRWCRIFDVFNTFFYYFTIKNIAWVRF